MVADIVDKSGGYVDARTLTRALSEDTEAGQPSLQDRQALVVSMRRAYGSGSLRQLDKLLARAKRIDPQDANYQAQIEELMTRIHPPKTDEKGAIVQQGYIDTEGE